MGLVYRAYLSSDKVYVCSCCGSHLANIDDVISKTFQGRHGRAYLFTNVVNVSVGKKEVRMLITGRHTVADISCNVCETVMGWKYVRFFLLLCLFLASPGLVSLTPLDSLSLNLFVFTDRGLCESSF